jgi:hypothetical protein
MNFYCSEWNCLSRVKEKDQLCDECKRSKELEERYQEVDYDDGHYDF